MRPVLGAALVILACSCSSTSSAEVTSSQPTVPARQSSTPRPRPPARPSATTHAAVKPSATAHHRPLHGVVIGIDPGHNGRNKDDPRYINHQIWNGREREACNTTGTETDAGYTETRYTFRVAQFLAHDLRRAGAKIVLTRHNNHGVGPCVNTRAHILDHAHADVGIDIHGDGGPASGRGFAVLEPVRDKENRHVVASSARFGRDLRHALLTGTPMPTSTYDGRNGINHRDDLAGLNLTTVPLVLIETGNMRNATDARLMTSTRFQRRIARAMEAAMKHFLHR